MSPRTLSQVLVWSLELARPNWNSSTVSLRECPVRVPEWPNVCRAGQDEFPHAAAPPAPYALYLPIGTRTHGEMRPVPPCPALQRVGICAMCVQMCAYRRSGKCMWGQETILGIGSCTFHLETVSCFLPVHTWLALSTSYILGLWTHITSWLLRDLVRILNQVLMLTPSKGFLPE